MADRKRVGGIALYFYAHFQLIEKETIMKKITALLLLLAVLTASLFAPALAEKKITIVAATFPLYDWTRQVLGENSDAELILLMDSGVDLHSFNPTAQDILRVASCDLFIYVGGESDEWVDDVLAAANNPDLVAINLMDVLGDSVKEEEIVEGMEEEAEEVAEEEEAGKEVEYDEHVWLSLKNASTLCQEIANRLGEIDPDGKTAYDANVAAYLEELSELDLEYQAMIENSSKKTVLFGDRFPFRYLTDDYGLNYYAAFVGCSAETEASFETVVFLANKVDELDLPAVLKIEGSDGKLAQTIVDNTTKQSAEIFELDSMQSVTAADVAQGANYLAAMENNLFILQEALK